MPLKESGESWRRGWQLQGKEEILLICAKTSWLSIRSAVRRILAIRPRHLSLKTAIQNWYVDIYFTWQLVLNQNCQYYTEDHYNNKFKSDNKFWVIHFNSRSLYANFEHIKSYLKQFTQPFTVIFITWINSEREMEFDWRLWVYMYEKSTSRITTHTSTLIDIYISNEVENKIGSGLTLNDISDHLAGFAVFN